MSPTEHEEHAEAAPNFDDDNPVIDINLNWYAVICPILPYQILNSIFLLGSVICKYIS